MQRSKPYRLLGLKLYREVEKMDLAERHSEHQIALKNRHPELDSGSVGGGSKEVLRFVIRDC